MNHCNGAYKVVPALFQTAQGGDAKGVGYFFSHEPLAGPVAKNAAAAHGLVKGLKTQPGNVVRKHGGSAVRAARLRRREVYNACPVQLTSDDSLVNRDAINGETGHLPTAQHFNVNYGPFSHLAFMDRALLATYSIANET